MWRQTSAILAGVLATLASTARAEPSPSLEAALEVQPGRDPCIAASALRARVQRWLKPGALQAGVTVVVNAAVQPLSFSLERGGSVVAKRNFDVLPAACDDRLDAVALAITLAIEHASAPGAGTAGVGTPGAPTPGATTPSTTAEPPRSAEPANGPDAKGQPETTASAKSQKPTQAEAEVEASAESPPDTAPTKGSLGHLRLEAGGTWLVEALPDPALAISAGVEWALIGPVQLELAGLFAPQSQTTLGEGSAHSQLFGGRALACLSGPAARFGLEGCAGAAGGVARATGSSSSSLPVSKTATMAWVAGVLRVALRYPADSRFSVRVAADGLANVVRPKLEVSGPGAPHPEYAFPLGFAGSLELLFALP
jgi:hypothetical protein